MNAEVWSEWHSIKQVTLYTVYMTVQLVHCTVVLVCAHFVIRVQPLIGPLACICTC